MSEKQEKVWVVVRSKCLPLIHCSSTPAKVFDDRKDARAYADRMEERSKSCFYSVVGVKKG